MKKFYDLILELQNENVGYLNLVQNGIFVQAIGKDAVLIRHIFSLKPCFEKDEVFEKKTNLNLLLYFTEKNLKYKQLTKFENVV